MFKVVQQFITDVRKTIRRITWPDKEALIQLTIVVISVTIVAGFILAGADFTFTKFISWITFKWIK